MRKKYYTILLLISLLYQPSCGDKYINKRKFNNFSNRFNTLITKLERITGDKKIIEDKKMDLLLSYFKRSINEMLKHLSDFSKDSKIHSTIEVLLEVKRNIETLSKLVKKFHKENKHLLSEEDNNEIQNIKEKLKVKHEKYILAIISAHNQLCKINLFKKCSPINIK